MEDLTFLCASQEESVELWTKNYGQMIHIVTIFLFYVCCVTFSTQEDVNRVFLNSVSFLYFIFLF
jgi:hypothetical protein